MNTCPQCNSVYGDEFVYCLNDGTLLLGGDQETLVRPRVEMHPAAEATVAFDSTACTACGYSNRGGSRFCKKCGAAIGVFGHGPFAQPNVGGQDTVSMNAGLFTPPQQVLSSPERRGVSPFTIALGVGAGLLVVLVAFILMQGGGTGTASTASSSGAANATNVANSTTTGRTALTASFSRDYTGTAAGRPINMHLERDNARLSGWVSSTRSTDDLEGSIEDDGDFYLTGIERGTYIEGNWTGKLDSSGQISGTWTPTGRGRSAQFFLTQDRP